MKNKYFAILILIILMGNNFIKAQIVTLEGRQFKIGANTQPANYYDVYNIKSQLNTAATNAVTGYIYDDKGNPIKDAVVFGANWLYTIQDVYLAMGLPSTPFVPEDDKFEHSTALTFTQSNGYFEIVPYNHVQFGIQDPHRIVNLNYMGVGTDKDFYGPGWQYKGGFGEIQIANPTSPLILARVTTGYDAVASNEVVDINESRNYYGHNSLTAFDLTLKGNSNLTARKEIHLKNELHAQASINNETHIFTSAGYPECDNFNGFARLSNPAVSSQDVINNSSNEIEIQFNINSELDARIYPNPSNGIFTIQVNNTNKEMVKILVQNLLGETIWQHTTVNKQVDVNFESLAKGVYIVQVKNSFKSISRKLIIK
ncbi:MAG: T9SS type A sorting domain-containing protein [Bacteroidetes bacterium]|nr:T9SS type A sorting domain-containing protein [Bacteroidota bacterium]